MSTVTDIENMVVGELVEPPAAPDQDAARRSLAVVGTVTAVLAVVVAVLKPPVGVFDGHNKKLAYYLTLAGIFVLGVLEIWVAMWASKNPPGRRAVVKAILYASVVPLLFVPGIGGFAFAK